MRARLPDRDGPGKDTLSIVDLSNPAALCPDPKASWRPTLSLGVLSASRSAAAAHRPCARPSAESGNRSLFGCKSLALDQGAQFELGPSKMLSTDNAREQIDESASTITDANR